MSNKSETYAAPAAGSSTMKKTKFSLAGIVFLIFCMCAAGAFGVEDMIPSVGPGLTILLLIIIPILWAAPMGIYTAELGALAPVDAGPYVWMKMAYGEMWGFCMNWWLMLAIYLGQAAYVVIAVGYIGKVIALTPLAATVIKVAIVVILTIVNLIGLKEVSILSTIFSIIIIVMFALVTIVGFANWNYNPIDPFIPEDTDIVSSLGTGLAIGIWLYCGYIQISNLGGEISNPEIVPKGMKVSIIIITLNFLLPTVAGLASMGNYQNWGTGIGEGTLNYSSVLIHYTGPALGVAFMIMAVISSCSTTNSVIASGSRLFLILAEDNLCPGFLSKLTKKSKMPFWPIVILAIVTIIFVNFDFSMIVNIVSPVLFVLYVGLAFAFLKIRKKYPVEKRNVWYAKGGKVLKAYVIGGMFLIGFIGIMVNGLEFFTLSFLITVSGVVFYVIFKRLYGGLYASDPQKYPINPKTKLAQGDIWRIGIFFMIFGLLMFAGSFVISWYEGSWGPDYYLQTYGSGLLSDFGGMISICRWCGLGGAVLGVILFVIGVKTDKVSDGE
ncbi:APC family permease [Ihubacter massiliensis]|uniref:APC family permease n=1 Tax=Hominibacterium faecale TaxID=2839743 RepID=A0A9J6QK79_9FIRM|nr:MULTISPECIES: APC family permease [Eubacteriales Family XIII. Incertae Sedis]MCI7302011.1 APC family permease [Clostridia bacterium]MDE8735016.1 APC family permease [Eubacteriales bacterium DFI.9.88]MDY3010715.1 APC family permease [Clostridiales Family XIII bacterium]MCO7123277.1 APC family permease [Ihubacter massiliensis]MCU7377537.1 APC family permease [Hominibacterium faecale]